jgi:hypothetical protein
MIFFGFGFRVRSVRIQVVFDLAILHPLFSILFGWVFASQRLRVCGLRQ